MANLITRTLTAVFGTSTPKTRRTMTSRLQLTSLEGRDMPSVTATVVSRTPTAALPNQNTSAIVHMQSPEDMAANLVRNSREVGLANHARDNRR
jgi:hypothetical protein